MFRGAVTTQVDGKRRLTVPSRFRDVLWSRGQGKAILTADPGRCLLLYAVPDWEPIEKQILAMPALEPSARALQRLLIGHAEEVELDAAGRILISSVLCAFAGIGKTAVLVGQGRRLEVWDEKSWQNTVEGAIEDARDAKGPWGCLEL